MIKNWLVWMGKKKVFMVYTLINGRQLQIGFNLKDTNDKGKRD